MEKRFQVFVSSTFRDLEEERQEVMHALLELDCMPSGMELFPAANETQWELIKRVIDDCDYYLLILGGRYGSIGPEGLSYTEMEYDYAISVGKPTIAFLHKEPGKIESEKSEKSEEGQDKLNRFRKKIEKKLCKHWISPADLGSVVSRSLIQLIKREPAVGWVRANELADKDATMELLRLRDQLDKLKAELSATRTSAPKGTEKLSQDDDEHLINYTVIGENKKTYRSTTFRAKFHGTWNEIFSCVSPLMIHEATNSQLMAALSDFCEQKNLEDLRKSDEAGDFSFSRFKIKTEDFQTILVQLRALGLINKSEKNVKTQKDEKGRNQIQKRVVTHCPA
jgi:hypothetical protein